MIMMIQIKTSAYCTYHINVLHLIHSNTLLAPKPHKRKKKKKGKKKNKVIRIWDYVSLAYLNKMFTLER